MATFCSSWSGPESALSASSAVERRPNSQSGPGLLPPRRATLAHGADDDVADALRAAGDVAQHRSLGSCQRRQLEPNGAGCLGTVVQQVQQVQQWFNSGSIVQDVHGF